MAADVSSMVNSTSNSEILITKDLLGGFSKVANKDLDLDLQDTKSWDAPHDFKVIFLFPFFDFDDQFLHRI